MTGSSADTLAAPPGRAGTARRRAARMLLACSLGLSGCATTSALDGITQRMHLPGHRAPKVAEEENPQKSQSKLAAVPPVVEKSAVAGQEKPGVKQHSPATRMLIEAELKDASPQEREEWIAYLNSVDAEKVPYILRARRMASNRQVQDGTAPPAISANEALQPVEHSLPNVIVANEQSHPLPEINPASGAALAANVIPPAQHPLAEPAQTPHVRQPGNEQAAAPGISQRIRSIAEPTWSWMHPGEPDAPQGDGAEPRSDRSMFGIPQLPQLLGTNPRPGNAPSARNEQRAETPARVAAASQAAAPVAVTPGAELWEDELRKVIALLEAETPLPRNATDAARQAATRRQVALRLLYLVNDDPNLAQQAIAGLPAAEQEFWTAVFMALADQRDSQLTEEERATRAVTQLRVAAHRLQSVARLQLRNVTRCDEIIGFGNYRATTGDRVSPGQSILVYAEIRNFHSDPTVDGFYRTAISSTVEIIAPDGQVLDRKSYPAEDLSRALRNDYFHSYRIDLPPSLNAGMHQLKLTIRDDLANKTATETLTFNVR